MTGGPWELTLVLAVSAAVFCRSGISWHKFSGKACVTMRGSTLDDYSGTLDELDRLLNDPDVPMQPALIWRLLDEVAAKLRTGTSGCAGEPLTPAMLEMG